MDAPRARRQQPRHHANRGGFPGSIRPEKAEKLSGVHAQVHMVHGNEVSETARQSFRYDCRLRHLFSKAEVCTGYSTSLSWERQKSFPGAYSACPASLLWRMTNRIHTRVLDPANCRILLRTKRPNRKLGCNDGGCDA